MKITCSRYQGYRKKTGLTVADLIRLTRPQRCAPCARNNTGRKIHTALNWKRHQLFSHLRFKSWLYHDLTHQQVDYRARQAEGRPAPEPAAGFSLDGVPERATPAGHACAWLCGIGHRPPAPRDMARGAGHTGCRTRTVLLRPARPYSVVQADWCRANRHARGWLAPARYRAGQG